MWSGGKHSRNDTMRTQRCLNRCTPSLILSLFHQFITERAPGLEHLRPWHCHNAHPVCWACHPRWCLSLNLSPTPLGNLVRNGKHRGEGYDHGMQHDDTLLNPGTNFGQLWYLSCLHPWRLASWSSYVALSSCSVNAWNLQIYWTLMTLRRKLTLNFSHSWTQNLVRAKVMRWGGP